MSGTELGADDEVLVDEEALPDVHHLRGLAELLHAVRQLRAVVVERQQPHAAAERRAHQATVRREA